MRIMLVIGALKSGGAERVITNLSNYLSKTAKDDVMLISIHYAVPVYPVSEQVEFINGLGGHNEFQAIVKLRRTIKKYAPDIILSFMTHINIAVLLAAWGTRAPVVVSERNDPASMPPQRSRRILRNVIYPMATGFVFQTEDAKHYFSKCIQTRSKVIVNPSEIFAEPCSLSERKPMIVTVGRLMKQKNQALLLRAFSNVSPRIPEYELHIYGDGPLEAELKSLAKSLGINEKTVFHGSVSNLHEQIRNSHIFVLTSDYEGMPNALMEAMALGLACISTDCPCGGPQMLIDDGESGFLIPVNDQRALECRLLELATEPEQRNMIAAKAMLAMEKIKKKNTYQTWRAALEEWCIHAK